ncbi:MAG: hypothetical protein DHS20C21_06720 [Gemmatimonadota bacterium]|nr:MAG: hypothetical protein DHS20C21_06720 [Gemmatimonadota bacterium]
MRLHAARSLGSPRKFGPIGVLRDEAERDMFARDVHELFLLPYAQAWKNGRLRGPAAGILGSVLSSNCSVSLDAMLARGRSEPGPALGQVLQGMLHRQHRNGFFFEPQQEAQVASLRGTERDTEFVDVTAAYLRYLIAFGLGKDERIRLGFDWLVRQQDPDGAWRPRSRHDAPDETRSYLRTRRVAQAFAELPSPALKRWGAARRQLATAWAARILERCDSPDAVTTDFNICADPEGPVRSGVGPDLPAALESRILYFPLEDLWLAMSIGASPEHPNLAPWVEWLRDTQLADGSWRLGNPALRERLLLSDPNGRLRAEALYLTDDWITLRGAQILRLAASRAATRTPSEAAV